MKIIGRTKEQNNLREYYDSGVPEFVAVYGRRRVGKTFLINEFFREEFAFSVIGSVGANKKAGLGIFREALRLYGDIYEKPPADWPEAFGRLKELLEKRRSKSRAVIFIDEMPWFDTRKSGFLPALEHFWNAWAATRPEIMLIACGSATAWMLENLIRSRGGLHNRVTRRMRIDPFTLGEAEQYLQWKNIRWNRREIAEAYMIFGGIPFYLNQLRSGTSLAQNVDELCFGKEAFMYGEYFTLYASLFENAEHHMRILEALSSHDGGLQREDIIAATGLPSGGSMTKVLEELEQCGFISRYNDYSGKKGRYIYQVTDFFTLFFVKHMKKNKQLDAGYWSKSIGKGAYNNWVGQSFEKLCLAHTDQILEKLGISGILASVYAWKYVSTEADKRGAQIDLLIDRVDGIVNVCECKFAHSPYVIDKDTEEKLMQRVETFRSETKTKKACHITMITTYGVTPGKYSGIVQSEVVLDDLF